MFNKYGAGRKFIYFLQTLETARIQYLNGVEVNIEEEPLRDLKATIYNLEKFRKLIDLDLIVLNDLYGDPSADKYEGESLNSYSYLKK